jgi:hypothetical protein
MAVSYNAALKNTRMTDVKTAIEAGVGNATLEVCSAAYASVLAIFTLPDPACSVAADVLTFLGVPLASAAAIASGTAAVARVKDSSGTVVVNSLTVGTSGTDCIITSTGITIGDTVNMTAGTLTHAA